MKRKRLLVATALAFATPAIGADCELEDAFVKDALGPGFGTVIDKQKLVPVIDGSGSLVKDEKTKTMKLGNGQTFGGFRVEALADGSLLQKAGLKDGDILVSVDGKALQIGDGFALFEAFRKDAAVKAKVRRGAEEKEIACAIRGRSQPK